MKIPKNKEVDFINNIASISISKICKENNIDRAGISKGKTTEEKIDIVFNNLLKEIINTFNIIIE